MDFKEEQSGEIEALLSIYEGELEGQFDNLSCILTYQAVKQVTSVSFLNMINNF